MKIQCSRYFYYPAILPLLLTAMLSFGGCSNPDKAKAAHLAKGEAYLKDSKFQEASLEFRNAIQIDDSLSAAHWGLARAFEGLQRWPETFDELKKTVALDQNNLDARIKLGNLYVTGSKGDAGLIAQGQKMADEVLKKDPNNIEGHILMGSVLFAQNKAPEAMAELNKAVELDPKRVESYLSLARYYIVTKDSAKAEETYKRAIELNSGSALAHTEYGRYLVATGKPVEAEVELRKAVEIDPKDRNSRFVLAAYYLLNKQYDKAEESYKALVDLDKDKPEKESVLADFYAVANRPDDAIRIYQGILAKVPDYLYGDYRLAEIMMARGDVSGAGKVLEKVLTKDSHDRQALLLRARLRSQYGQADFKNALEDLKEVLRQEPNSRGGLYSMSQVYYSMGVMDQARSFAAELEKQYPDYLPAKLLQVQISIADHDPKGAVRLATDLLDRLNKTAVDRETTPQLIEEMKARTYLTLGIAQGQLKDYKAAREAFTSARAIQPNSADVYTNLAAVSIAENKPEEAVGFYENALSVDQVNYNALSGLTRVYVNQGKFDLAHARVDKALASYPNNAPLHFLKAQIYGSQQNGQGAETELTKALELDPNYINAYYALAALFINSHQVDKAIAEYRRVIERRPDSAGAYTLIGMLEDAGQKYDESIQSYKKALDLDRSAVIAANNLAWIYAVYNKGNLDEAVRLAQGVVQQLPNVAGFADTLGWVYYKKGLYGAAVEQLQKAVSMDEAVAKNLNGTPSPVYPYHLGVALKAKGDREGAKRQLEAALRFAEKVPFADSEEAKKALATL